MFFMFRGLLRAASRVHESRFLIDLRGWQDMGGEGDRAGLTGGYVRLPARALFAAIGLRA